MKILKTVERFPGGLVVIPLLISASINTFFPGALRIGGVTTALFVDGTYTIIGLLLFFSGCQLRVSQMGAAIKRGGAMILVKIGISFIAGFILLRCFGPAGFWGIPTVALVTAISNNKPVVYLALVEKYGDEADVFVFGLLCLVSMPILPLAVLGLAGGTFDYMEIVTLLVPFVLGFALANLDRDIADMMSRGTTIMLPFIGFCFGSSINLANAFKATGTGALLLIIYTVSTMAPQLAVDRLLLKRSGYAALASCTIGGTVVVVPAIIAKAIPEHAPYVDIAVAQLAFAMTFSCILTPFLTRLWVKFVGGAPQSVKTQPEEKGV